MNGRVLAYSELWERWKSGQCASDIARALARTKGAIHHVLAFNGGIAPVTRRRCPVALVLDEREEISRGIAAGRSIRRIAAGLGRSPSTISREVARHGGRNWYRATEADARAWEWALRPKPCRLASHPELRWRVAEKLALWIGRPSTGKDQGCDPPCLGVQWRNRAGSSSALSCGAGAC